MDVSLAAAVVGTAAGGAGLLTGALAARARPRRAGRHRGALPVPAPAGARHERPVPDGLVEVLAVLRASSVLLDGSDTVVQASSGAYAFGLVRDGRLVSDELRRLAREVRRDGRIRQVELELPRGPLGGETIAVSARLAALGTTGAGAGGGLAGGLAGGIRPGEPAGGLVLVLVEDRTEARRVDAVRRDFVANVSHELKTPVGALILLAEAVLDASDEPEAVQRFAQRMQYEASRLSNLVQELIDLSRVQGHDPLREAQVVEVDVVVGEALERVRLAAVAKNIGLVTGGEPGLTVLGDEAQLVTAVRNLVDNAVSYSPEHTRVAVGVKRAGELVEISVTDQGFGIPERDLERIFERFYRVDPARSRATGGTGLGLSIAKHITTNHGGEVTVWSVEGSGSTFTIRLPVGTGRSPATSSRPDPPDVVAGLNPPRSPAGTGPPAVPQAPNAQASPAPAQPTPVPSEASP